jgi:hypothetical protein
LSALSLADRYDALDAALQRASFPATSTWWLAEIRRFLRARVRRWIIRAGRRAGKSTTLVRLLVCWALWGSWSVPPGDTPIVAIVSVNKTEAKARLKTVADVLRALGVPFEQRGEEIETQRGVVFRVFAANIDAVGFTAIAVFCDEAARWESRESGANPAQHVIGSLAPTMATVPGAFMIVSSSPWSTEDYHHELFEQGDTAHQLTSFAETWRANPTLSEAQTHELEPNHATWLREYAAQPSDAITGNWFGTAVDLAIDTGRTTAAPHVDGRRYFVAIDQAFQRDNFAYSVVTSEPGPFDPSVMGRAKRITTVQEVGAWVPDRSPRELLLRLKNEVLRRFGGEHRIFGDQFGAMPLQELASDVGLRLMVHAWTGGSGETSKAACFRDVREQMIQGVLRIPDDPDLIREFRSVRGVLTPSGNERIEVPRTAGGHGDRVSAAVLACTMALNKNPLLPDGSENHWDRQEAARKRNELSELMCRLSR